MNLNDKNKIKIIEILNYEDDKAISIILISNNISILLDCGLPFDYSFNKYKKFSHHLKNIDMIIISKPELEYCGSLNFLMNEYKIKNIITTLPCKLLIENIFNDLYGLFKLENSFFDNNYTNMNLIQILKYKENLKIKIGKNKIKIKFLELGDRLGSSFIKIIINSYKIGYLVNPLIESQIHIPPLNIKIIENINFDLLIIGNKKTKKITNKFNNILKQEFDINNNKEKDYLIITDNFSNFFKIIIEIIIFIRENRYFLNNYNVTFPFNLKFTFDIMKSLTEFMANNINHEFYEENSFILNEFKSFKKIGISAKKNIAITLLEDVLYGNNHNLLKSNYEIIYYGDTDLIDFKNNLYEIKKNNLNFLYNFESKDIVNDTSTVVSDNITINNINEGEKQDILNLFNIEIKTKLNNNLFDIKNEYFNFNINTNENDIDDYGEILSIEQIEIYQNLEKKNFNIKKINYESDYKEANKIYLEELKKYYNEDNNKEIINDEIINKIKLYHFSNNANIFNFIKILKNLNFNNLFLLKNNIIDSEYIIKIYKNIIIDTEYEYTSNLINCKIPFLNLLKNLENNFFINKIKFNISNLKFKILENDFINKNYNEIKIEENINDKNNLYNKIYDEKKIYSEINLLDLKKYLEIQNYKFDLNYSILNYENKLFIKKSKNYLIIESSFIKEYVEIRNYIYKYIKLI